MGISKRVLTVSGSYLIKQAERLARSFFRRRQRTGMKYRVVDGYVLRGSRAGSAGAALVMDLPGYFFVPGLSRVEPVPGTEMELYGNVGFVTGHRDYFLRAYRAEAVFPVLSKQAWELGRVNVLRVPGGDPIDVGLRSQGPLIQRSDASAGASYHHLEVFDGQTYNYWAPQTPTRAVLETWHFFTGLAFSRVFLTEQGELQFNSSARMLDYTGLSVASGFFEDNILGGQAIVYRNADPDSGMGTHAQARQHAPVFRGYPFGFEQQETEQEVIARARYLVAAQVIEQLNEDVDHWGARSFFLSMMEVESSIPADSQDGSEMSRSATLQWSVVLHNTDVPSPVPEREPVVDPSLSPPRHLENRYRAFRYAQALGGQWYAMLFFRVDPGEESDVGRAEFADLLYLDPEGPGVQRVEVARHDSTSVNDDFDTSRQITAARVWEGDTLEDGSAVFISLPTLDGGTLEVIHAQGSDVSVTQFTTEFFAPAFGHIPAGGISYIGSSRFMFLASTGPVLTRSEMRTEEVPFPLVAVVYDHAGGTFDVVGTVQAEVQFAAVEGGVGRPWVIQWFEQADGEESEKPAFVLASGGAPVPVGDPQERTGTGLTWISYDTGQTWQQLSDEVGGPSGIAYVGGKLYTPPARP